MLRPAIIFSDHLVIQRGKKIRVFGECSIGSKVEVILRRGKEEVSVKAVVRNQCFEAVLPAQTKTSLGESCELIITDGSDVITYTDVAIGEVWLAGGQSNMELELQNAEGGREILNAPLEDDDIRKQLRYFYTPKVSVKDDQYEDIMRNTGWSLYNKDSASAWSAVAYFFAKKLAMELGVTVGIIGCNWGGTSASCWMSREYLLSRSSTKSYVEEYEASEHFTKPREQQIKEYQEYLDYHTEWDKKSGELYASIPGITWDEVQERIGKCQYPGPMNCANFTRPYGLYDTMVSRLIPYTLGGVIYYQGESDDHKPDSYYDLQNLLIKQWRKDFKDDNLFFVMTQLPMHRYQDDPDTQSWCVIREAQMQNYKDIKNSGIAVIIDQGKFNEIHPPKKNEVGNRLAMQALHLIDADKYSEKACFGPVFKDAEQDENRIIIGFDYAEDGFLIKNEGDDTSLGFEIAGDDGQYYPAEVKIQDHKVLVSSKEINNPMEVRYLWTNYGEVFLFGKNDLPLAPFRYKCCNL